MKIIYQISRAKDTHKREFDERALENFQKNKIENFSNSVQNGKPIRKRHRHRVTR